VSWRVRLPPPVLLGNGVRLIDNPGGSPIPLRRLDVGDPGAVVNVRYRLSGG